MCRDGQRWSQREAISSSCHPRPRPTPTHQQHILPNYRGFASLRAWSNYHRPHLSKFRHRNQLPWLRGTTGGRWFGQIHHWLVSPFLIIDSCCLPLHCVSLFNLLFLSRNFGNREHFWEIAGFYCGSSRYFKGRSIVFSQGLYGTS